MKFYIFLFSALLLFSACKKEPVPNTGSTTSGPKFMNVPNSISFQVDGKNYSYTEGSSGYMGGCAMGSNDTVIHYLQWNTQSYTLTNGPSLFFTFVKHASKNTFVTDPGQTYSDFFSVGDHCYNYIGNTCSESTIDIHLNDFNSKSYMNFFSTSLPNDYFTITSSVKKINSQNVVEQHVKGNFELDAYDGLGDTLKIRNGAFYLVFKWH